MWFKTIRRKWFYALIPVITIACCIPYIGTLIQIGSIDKKAEAEKGLKIATYNVAMFGRETSGFLAQDILAQMRRHKVDVLCLQEYNEISGDKKNSESYKDFFPYMATGRGDMVVFSRIRPASCKHKIPILTTASVTVACSMPSSATTCWA